MDDLTEICRTCINYRRPRAFVPPSDVPPHSVRWTRPGLAPTEPYCFADQMSVARHVSLVVCPISRFPADAVPSPAASETSEDTGPPLTLLEAAKAVPCLPCQKKAAICGNCGGQHETAKCPIPVEFDGNYQNDSGGDPGCNCA